MPGLKLSNIVTMIPDCLMSNDERTFFDWLVFKCSYNFDWFRHSIPQIQNETGVKRRMQDAIITKFKELGFLRCKITYYQNNPYRTFYVDFSELAKDKVLNLLFEEGTPTFDSMFSQFKELAKEQKLQIKRSRSQQKIEGDREQVEAEAFKKLLKEMDETWNSRIRKYNEGELTDGKIPERKKTETKLHKTRQTKTMLKVLRKDYDDRDINNSLLAYADDFLVGNVKVNHILPYFLKE